MFVAVYYCFCFLHSSPFHIRLHFLAVMRLCFYRCVMALFYVHLKWKNPNQFLFSLLFWVCTHKHNLAFFSVFALGFFCFSFGKCDIITRKLVTNFTWSEKQSFCLSETQFNFSLFFVFVLHNFFKISLLLFGMCSLELDVRMKKLKERKKKEGMKMGKTYSSRIILLGAMIFHRGWQCHKL